MNDEATSAGDKYGRWGRWFWYMDDIQIYGVYTASGMDKLDTQDMTLLHSGGGMNMSTRLIPPKLQARECEVEVRMRPSLHDGASGRGQRVWHGRGAVSWEQQNMSAKAAGHPCARQAVPSPYMLGYPRGREHHMMGPCACPTQSAHGMDTSRTACIPTFPPFRRPCSRAGHRLVRANRGDAEE